MTRHRAFNWGLTALAALTFALVLSASHLLDTPDHSNEWVQSQLLKNQQALDEVEARIQAAAQRACTAARGPNSAARWTEGKWVCTTRSGVRKVQVAWGAL